MPHSQFRMTTILIEQHRPTPILGKKPSQVLSRLNQIFGVLVEHDQNFVSGNTFIKTVDEPLKERKATNLIVERII
jgi:hypothetical protein